MFYAMLVKWDLHLLFCNYPSPERSSFGPYIELGLFTNVSYRAGDPFKLLTGDTYLMQLTAEGFWRINTAGVQQRSPSTSRRPGPQFQPSWRLIKDQPSMDSSATILTQSKAEITMQSTLPNG